MQFLSCSGWTGWTAVGSPAETPWLGNFRPVWLSNRAVELFDDAFFVVGILKGFCVATESFGIDNVDDVLLGIEPFLARPPAVLGAIILGPL